MIIFSRAGAAGQGRACAGTYAANMTADYRLLRNQANRYRQDRDGDADAQLQRHGQLLPRPRRLRHRERRAPSRTARPEQLGLHGQGDHPGAAACCCAPSSDVQAGRDPPHVVRDPAANDFAHHVVTSVVMPDREDWRTLWRPEGHAPAPARVGRGRDLTPPCASLPHPGRGSRGTPRTSSRGAGAAPAEEVLDGELHRHGVDSYSSGDGIGRTMDAHAVAVRHRGARGGEHADPAVPPEQSASAHRGRRRRATRRRWSSSRASSAARRS